MFLNLGLLLLRVSGTGGRLIDVALSRYFGGTMLSYSSSNPLFAKFTARLLFLAATVGVVHGPVARADESPAPDVAPTQKRSPATEKLASLQRALNKETALDVQMQITYLVGGFGRTVPQGPQLVRIAWDRPDLLFIYAPTNGNSPSVWYWLDSKQLQIYEEWPLPNSVLIRARGVRVTDLMELAGNADRAFKLAYSHTEKLAVIGHLGLRYLEMLRTVPLDQVAVEQIRGGWKVTVGRAAAEQSLPEPFRRTENRGVVVFDLHQSGDDIELGAIHVLRDPKRPEFVETATFDVFRFTADKERLRLPEVPLTAVRVKNVEGLNTEIVDSVRPIKARPVAAPKAP